MVVRNRDATCFTRICTAAKMRMRIILSGSCHSFFFTSEFGFADDASSHKLKVPENMQSRMTETPKGSAYEVYIRRLADDEDTSITISSTSSVGDLKGLVKEKFDIPIIMQRLVLGENTILNEESKALEVFGVSPGVKILVIKVPDSFAVGNELEAKGANGRWMHGTITEINADADLTLKLHMKDDDMTWPKVYRANTRPIRDFEVGDSLEGMDATGQWFPIVVKVVNDGGAKSGIDVPIIVKVVNDDGATYGVDVLRDDGSVQRHWENSLRRNMREAIDFSTNPNGHYYARDFDGNAWPIKIVKRNDDCSYFCKVEDGHGTKWERASRCNMW